MSRDAHDKLKCGGKLSDDENLGNGECGTYRSERWFPIPLISSKLAFHLHY